MPWFGWVLNQGYIVVLILIFYYLIFLFFHIIEFLLHNMDFPNIRKGYHFLQSVETHWHQLLVLLQGRSCKFSPQRVGISHTVCNDDVVQIVKKWFTWLMFQNDSLYYAISTTPCYFCKHQCLYNLKLYHHICNTVHNV